MGGAAKPGEAQPHGVQFLFIVQGKHGVCGPQERERGVRKRQILGMG